MSVPIDITPVPDARRAALRGLLDDDPDGRAPAAAVALYSEHRRGPHADLLGRLRWPAGGLEALAGELVATLRPGEAPWGIAAVSGSGPAWVEEAAAAVGRIAEFAGEMEPAAVVGVVEIPVPDAAASSSARLAGELREVLQALGGAGAVVPFFGVPARDVEMVESVLDEIVAERTRRGRILGASLDLAGRLGGVVPGAHHVARFLDGCRRRELPVRLSGVAVGAGGFGVLPLLAAGALAVDRAAPVAALERVLAEDRLDRFEFRGRRMLWSGVPIEARDLSVARERLLTAVSGGSFAGAAAALDPA